MSTRRSFLVSAAACAGVAALPQRAYAALPHTGVTQYAFGDSLTSGELNYGKPITRILKDRIGLSYRNLGIGGTTFSPGGNDTYDALSMYELCQAKLNGHWEAQRAAVDTIQPASAAEYYAGVLDEMAAAPLDSPRSVITFAFGTNDFFAGREVGLDSDEGKDTFKGAINHVVSEVSRNFVSSQIMLVTPVWCVDADVANSAGHRLIDYVEAIKRISELRSVPLVDLYSTSGIGPDNSDSVLSDGIHPTSEGYDLVGRAWVSALLEVLPA